MPLPDDQEVVQTSEETVKTLHDIFGPQPGIRPGKTNPPLDQPSQQW